MAKTAFITGILGQDGPYLAKLLLEKDYKVYGMIRRYSKVNFENLEYLGISKNIEYVEGDLTDESSLNHLVKSLNLSTPYLYTYQTCIHNNKEPYQCNNSIKK